MATVIWRRYDAPLPGSAAAAAPTPTDAGTIHLQSPHRAPSVEADFFVPLLQALTTGLVFGLAAAVIGARVTQQPFIALAPITVATACALAWLWRLGAIHSTLWRIDAILGDEQPQPAPSTHIMSLNGYQGQRNQADDAKLQLEAQFSAFVLGCESDTSLRRWERKIGRTRYAEFRDALISAGYARWNNPNDQRAGWKLTTSHDRVMFGLTDGALKLPYSPPEEAA